MLRTATHRAPLGSGVAFPNAAVQEKRPRVNGAFKVQAVYRGRETLPGEKTLSGFRLVAGVFAGAVAR